MYIILGAIGHIGSVVARNLLNKGLPVTIVTRSNSKAREWEQQGAKAAVTDVLDTPRLRQIFQQGNYLFLLNPPADPSTDIAKEERKSVSSILEALKGSGIKKVVAQSTYGAQRGHAIGDLGVLYDMEQGLSEMSIPSSIVRGAYYMSNWDLSFQSALHEGSVYSFFPKTFKLPMVAPADLGDVATELLIDPYSKPGIHHVEGPEEYSAEDVAKAFSMALGKEVQPVEIPQEEWKPTLMSVGFSKEAAESMAAMTKITLDKNYTIAGTPIKGKVTIYDYINGLKNQNSSQP